MALQLKGKTYFVPGAYLVTEILEGGVQTEPVFNVGVIIGAMPFATPYTVGTGSSPQPAGEFIKGYADAATIANELGTGDFLTFYRYAKRKGAGKAYFLNVAPLTKMSGGIIQNSAPENALSLSSKRYGAQENWNSITIVGGVHTLIPPKNVVFLAADSGTGKTITLKGELPSFKPGDVVLLTSNTHTTPESKTIEIVDVANKKITFTTNIATNATVANYALIFQEGTDAAEVSSAALDSAEKVNAFYNNSKIAAVSVLPGVTLMPATLTKTYFGNLASATKATSPSPTSSDWQAVADNFARWNEEFASTYKVYMRVLGLVTSDAANHAAFASLATQMRQANKPIQIVTGCALGDYLIADSSPGSPIYRAKALNTDEVQLAGWGLEGNPAYVSLAGEFFGIRLANDVVHNQTRDDIDAAFVERAYYDRDPNAEKYIVNGVSPIITTKTGFKIGRGVNTYQDQSTPFNKQSQRTYLVMLRDMADFDARAILELMDAQVGVDGVTPELVSSAAVSYSENAVAAGRITAYKINSCTRVGDSIILDREIQLTPGTDFIGVVQKIKVQ